MFAQESVMGIKELKAEFEKLKCIEEKLEYLNFDEHLDCYVEKSNGMPVGLAAWVNGAFYGFEQAATAQAVPKVIDFGNEFNRPNKYEVNKINNALLEYRRQHNIFEVGDSVLPISNYSDQVHFLADWYIENLDFRYTTNSGSWGIIVKSLMDGAWRHATNEEIKAGKRLEVNQ